MASATRAELVFVVDVQALTNEGFARTVTYHGKDLAASSTKATPGSFSIPR